MKSILILAFIASSSLTFAQSTLQFTIQQLPELIVDAGRDTTVIKSTQVKLGGAKVAKGGSGAYTYAWSPINGLDKSDIANPIATVDSAITYTLSVNDGKTCIKSSSISLRTNTVTGINPVVSDLGLAIYPNPNNGIFFITTAKPINDKTLMLQIFDVNGRSIYTRSIKGNTRLNQGIFLVGIAKGLYLLKLSSREINQTYKLFVD
jgi:hypothetical protein